MMAGLRWGSIGICIRIGGFLGGLGGKRGGGKSKEGWMGRVRIE